MRKPKLPRWIFMGAVLIEILLLTVTGLCAAAMLAASCGGAL